MEETKIESKDLGQDGFKVIHYKTIDSTQKEIWRRVKNGTIENKTIVIADIQTSGIGTHGRTWHTDEENNIAFSVYFDFLTTYFFIISRFCWNVYASAWIMLNFIIFYEFPLKTGDILL